MKWILAGLGNPGGAYAKTRHNAGRIVLEHFRETHDLPEWEYKKSSDALIAEGEVNGVPVFLLEPETFMNASGKSLQSLVKSKKQAAQLVVIHDDIDLPLGKWKFSFDRGSGGQKGVESIMTTLKTRAFIRVRIGVLPTTLGGKTKKPKGGEAVEKFILGKFKTDELPILASVGKEVSGALSLLFAQGLEHAMTHYN